MHRRANSASGKSDSSSKYLYHHNERFQPQAVIIEAPMLNPKRDRLLTIRKLYCAHGFVEWFFKNQSVEVSEVSAKKIKSRVTGNHLASKADVVAVARKCGLRLPSAGYEDAADAWGGWLLGIDHYNRTCRERWDKAIHGQRGMLF